MISIDTNILVRLVIDDPDDVKQIQRVRESIRKDLNVFICQPVQLETAWVLKRRYKLGKREIAMVFESLLENMAIKLEDEAVLKTTLEYYRTSNVDFGDAMILVISEANNFPLKTLDKGLLKMDGVLSVEQD